MWFTCLTTCLAVWQGENGCKKSLACSVNRRYLQFAPTDVEVGMAWNQPDDKKPEDPWGRGGDKQQPPELDKIFKDIRKQLSGWLGGKKSPGGKGGKSLSPMALLGLLLVGLVTVFVLSGFFRVTSGQRVVILFHGQVGRVVDTGLHWYNPLFENLVAVPSANDRDYQQTSDLLTSDNNLANVTVDVSYRVVDPAAYALSVAAPVMLLQDMLAASLRTQVATHSLNDLSGSDHQVLAEAVKSALTKGLKAWHSGIEITSVDIPAISVPDALKSSLESLQNAQSQAQAAQQAAEDYRKTQLLAAQSQAQNLMTEADAYQKKTVDYAEGETSRFNSLLKAYEKAPGVTRERLYLDAMEALFSKSPKVLVMDDKGRNVLSLPLAEMMKVAPSAGTRPASVKATASSSPATAATDKATENQKAGSPPSLYDDNNEPGAGGSGADKSGEAP
jgi:membrane protease subunit HflK